MKKERTEELKEEFIEEAKLVISMNEDLVLSENQKVKSFFTDTVSEYE